MVPHPSPNHAPRGFTSELLSVGSILEALANFVSVESYFGFVYTDMFCLASRCVALLSVCYSFVSWAENTTNKRQGSQRDSNHNSVTLSILKPLWRDCNQARAA